MISPEIWSNGGVALASRHASLSLIFIEASFMKNLARTISLVSLGQEVNAKPWGKHATMSMTGEKE